MSRWGCLSVQSWDWGVMASYYSYLRCLLVALAFLVTMGRGQQSSPPSPPAPTVKFKDLEAIVNSKTRYNVLPFDVQVDFVKITVNAVLVPITIQIPNRAMTFVSKDGVARATVNIFGRVTTPTG